MRPRGLAGLLVDLLYPRRCVDCGAFGQVVCSACEARLSPCDTGARCPHCRARWEDPGNCPRCFSWQALDGAIVAVDMEGPGRKVVHGLKYHRVHDLARFMAPRMSSAAGGTRFDAAFAVPLHRSRRNERGFNQAELLLSRLGWPIAEGRLLRARKTDTQVGMRHAERQANVRGAFRYEGPRLDGLTVALVDDVITTGATMNECAKVLKDHGARQVWAVAFARANYDPAPGVEIDD